MILDTCFLIDAERKKSETTAFLKANATERLCIAAITVGELGCGFDSPELSGLLSRLRHFQILDVTPEVACCYSTIYRVLREAGCMIGTNDLWIAATALTYRLPLVTRNVEEFTRVSGLRVVRY